MSNTQRFRSRAVAEAIQFDGTNGAEIVDFLDGFVTDAGDNFGPDFMVEVWGGSLRARRGEWVVRDDMGHAFVLSQGLFRRTYEPQEEAA